MTENFDEIIANINTLATEHGLDAVEVYVKEQLGEAYPENVPEPIALALYALTPKEATCEVVDPA